MKETVTIFAESIEDVSANGPDVLEVTLSGVDLSQLVSEVGITDLLGSMDIEDIKQYIKDKEEEEKEDEE